MLGVRIREVFTLPSIRMPNSLHFTTDESGDR